MDPRTQEILRKAGIDTASLQQQETSSQMGSSGMKVDPNRGYTSAELDAMEKESLPSSVDRGSVFDSSSIAAQEFNNATRPQGTAQKIGSAIGYILIILLLVLVIIKLTKTKGNVFHFLKSIKLFFINNLFPIVLTIASFIFLTQIFQDKYFGIEWLKVISATTIICLVSFYVKKKS